MRAIPAAAIAVCVLALAGCQSSSAALSGVSPKAVATPSQPVQGGPTPSQPVKGGPTIFLPTTAQLSASRDGVVWTLVAQQLLFRSTDNGDNFEPRPLPAPEQHPFAMSFIDSLEGWLMTATPPEMQCLTQSVLIWHTSDGGSSWARVSGLGLPAAQCKTSITFVDSMHGFVVASDENHRPTVYRTSDGGSTWKGSTLPDPPGFVTQAGGFALQPGDVTGFGDQLLVAAYAAQNEYVFSSIDGGATWAYLSTSSAIPMNVAFVTASRWLKIANDGGGWETTDGGKTWHAFSCDYADAAGIVSSFVFADATVGFGTVRGTIYRTVDGGAHWVKIETPGVFWPT